jgi:hypothetical protein
MQLALNCPKLTEVSFSYSDRVTNNCVPQLRLLTKLQFINIYATQIDSTRYGLLLSELPNIADIRFENNQDNLLPHIAPETLNTITHVYGYANDINMQVQKFPKTKKFVVSLGDIDLSAVSAWTELRTLDIINGDCPTFNLNAILTGVGHNLTELTLAYVRNLNLQDMITLCTSLESLSLNRCSILPLNPDTPLNPQLPHFRNLISLRIERAYPEEADFSFIRYYVSLEKIHLNGIDIFTEEFMREVLRLGTLANLKECYITESFEGALTFQVLQLLIQHCSHLKRFGYTKRLPSLNSANVLNLQREMLEQNFDIDFI